jgi:hypothetical protein
MMWTSTIALMVIYALGLIDTGAALGLAALWAALAAVTIYLDE